MVKIEKRGPDRVDITLDGSIDGDEMRTALTTLLEASEGMKGAKMLYTIRNFALPSLGAMAVEFGMLPQLFGLVGRFDRCAVLCETAWIRTAAEIEGALIPGLDIKAFDLNFVDRAEDWLLGVPSDTMPV